MKYSPNSLPAALFLRHGFNETEVSHLFRFRNGWRPNIKVVSHVSTPQLGFGGVVAQPTFTPETWIRTFRSLPQTIFLPGPLNHAFRVLQDPRSFDFIADTVRGGGACHAPADVLTLVAAADQSLLSLYSQMVPLSVEAHHQPLPIVEYERIELLEELGV